MSENGTHVTRAELEAHLKPIRSDIGEIKGDVKKLLLAHAGSKAVSTFFWKASSLVAALFCGVLATLLIH